MSSASGGSFNSSLPIWIILFYFFFSYCCEYEFSYCIKWAVRVGIFSLILNLAGRLSSFQFWVLYWLCFYNKWLVLCWDMFLLHSVWWVFLWMDVGLYQILFFAYWNYYVIFAVFLIPQTLFWEIVLLNEDECLVMALGKKCCWGWMYSENKELLVVSQIKLRVESFYRIPIIEQFL